jgi:hypothetical protein
MNIQSAQPRREGASSSGVDVFPNVEHASIITYTLVSLMEKQGREFDCIGPERSPGARIGRGRGRSRSTDRMLRLSVYCWGEPGPLTSSMRTLWLCKQPARWSSAALARRLWRV